MNNEKNSLDTYLQEIGQQKPLSDDEEKLLARLIGEGDQQAAGRLTAANLPFVVSLARQYAGHGLSVEDLISEGNIGMLRAAAHYKGGKRFVVFAAPYVRQAMSEAIDQQAGLYRVPRDVMNAAAEKRRARALSIDAPVGGSPELSLGRVVADTHTPDPRQLVESDEERQELAQAISQLDERSQRVIRHLYGIDTEPLSMAETAKEMGLKRERVRQIRDRALRKIRRPLPQH